MGSTLLLCVLAWDGSTTTSPDGNGSYPAKQLQCQIETFAVQLRVRSSMLSLNLKLTILDRSAGMGPTISSNKHTMPAMEEIPTNSHMNHFLWPLFVTPCKKS